LLLAGAVWSLTASLPASLAVFAGEVLLRPALQALARAALGRGAADSAEQNESGAGI
jgi:hypothetical protein